MPKENLEVEIRPKVMKKGNLKLEAVHQGKVVGTYFIYTDSFFPSNNYYSNLDVEENFRQKGVGRALIFAALNTYLPQLALLHKNGIEHRVAVQAGSKISPSLKKYFQDAGYVEKRALIEKYLTKVYPNGNPQKQSKLRRLFGSK